MVEARRRSLAGQVRSECYKHCMADRSGRRERYTELMTDHVLANGLPTATLRPLAAAAGTSDRMLMYYYRDKDDLLTAVLETIATRLLGALDEAVPLGTARPFPILLQEIWAVLGSEEHMPFMRLWLDLTSAAARGEQPHQRVAREIADGYLDWIGSRLDTRSGSAAVLMVCIEGMYLLTAVGRPELARAALGHLAPAAA